MTVIATGLFETLILVDDPERASMHLAALKASILARRAASPGVRLSNIGGWQSDIRMLDWGGPSAAWLMDQIVSLADRFTKDIAATASLRHSWQVEMWANVSPPDASNQMHTHPGAFWSAVYYVDDGYGSSGGGDQGGELILLDPRMPTILMAMPNLRFRGADGGIHEPQMAMKPKTGRIVMFPAWLSHAVMPYRGTGERISIALNLTARPC